MWPSPSLLTTPWPPTCPIRQLREAKSSLSQATRERKGIESDISRLEGEEAAARVEVRTALLAQGRRPLLAQSSYPHSDR